jgi:RNA polymerase sigma-70 factor (ECF subfamily)
MTEPPGSAQYKDVSGAVAIAEPMPEAPDFRAVYEAEFDYVYHTLRRLGVPDRDLEDLLHEVFIAYYKSQASYDPRRPLKPWLFGIAFRVASDWRRRAHNRYEVPSDHEERFASPAPAADEQVAARQRRELVLAALETLDLDRRAVFVMHDLDGHSMPEIAQVLAVPLNTLYSRLRLARAAFAQAVKRAQLRRGGK